MFFAILVQAARISLSLQKDDPHRNNMNFTGFDRDVGNENISCEIHNMQGHRTPSILQMDAPAEVLPNPDCIPNNIAIGENKVHAESSVRYFKKYESDYNSGINDRLSTSKSNNNDSSYTIKNEVDTGEKLSLDNVIADHWVSIQ